MRRALLPVLAALGACGYRVGGLYEVREVRLRIFDTQSERRTHEFDLTEAVARELLAKGIRVNASSARHELTGEIVDFDQPVAVVNERDVPIVGTVAIKLRIRLTDRETGAVVRDAERVETAAFTNARFESAETARQEVFDRLARWISSNLETDW